jgi:hypothetical protein
MIVANFQISKERYIRISPDKDGVIIDEIENKDENTRFRLVSSIRVPKAQLANIGEYLLRCSTQV